MEHLPYNKPKIACIDTKVCTILLPYAAPSSILLLHNVFHHCLRLLRDLLGRALQRASRTAQRSRVRSGSGCSARVCNSSGRWRGRP